MRKRDWWLVACIGLFVTLNALFYPYQEKSVPISPGLAVDQLKILNGKDYETITSINQDMMKQKHPMQLWVRVLKRPPKSFSDDEGSFDGYTSLRTDDYLEKEIERTRHLLKGAEYSFQHSENWYYDHVCVLLIISQKSRTNISLISSSFITSDMQREYMRAVLPKQIDSRWKLMIAIKGYAWFVARHAGIDEPITDIEQLSSAVIICYLTIITIMAVIRYMKKDTGYHGGPGPDEDNDYWIEDEKLTYGDDWNGIDNNGD
ncbi:hypothetical protein [Lacticaseibacillus paracasei]|uniref:hypothetical protein n=1 Tax=Lacticaseibacillus paracasei TaxID=1597 RepID=UPI000F0BDC03|nr:hypothetical protein [Lacticaseibacillus paracasei]RNE16617.1 hypothetical protein FAM3257_03147 [Lacticaseibacillus paracasei]TLQ33665.1 hypothetical protein FEZ40_16440 [Lacticaseibacillus paracasei]